eukprot:6367498-Pyramimonas_sp.AAC.1
MASTSAALDAATLGPRCIGVRFCSSFPGNGRYLWAGRSGGRETVTAAAACSRQGASAPPAHQSS